MVPVWLGGGATVTACVSETVSPIEVTVTRSSNAGLLSATAREYELPVPTLVHVAVPCARYSQLKVYVPFPPEALALQV